MAPSPDAAEVADALARVYARPEFVERPVSPIWQTLSDWWLAFRSWFFSLFGRLDFLEGWSPWLIRALLLVLVGLAVAAAAYLIWQVLMPVRVGSSEGTARDEAPPMEIAVDWEEAARRAESEGRLRDAAFALYNAAIFRLDERGTVRLQVGKTPGDYRREVRADPSLRQPFERMVKLFLPLAFGASPPDVRSFGALRSAAEEVGVRA